MKKLIKYLSILAISAVAATSCSDYLEVDKYFNDRMTLENVFTNQDYAEQWLADTYSHLKGNNTEVCGKYSSPHNFADDQTFGDGHRTDHYGYVTSGRWEDVDYASNVWEECYNGIRKATIFMQNVHMLIADSRYVTEEDVKDYHAQARFVRAYYYWLLLKKYGPVPVLGDDILDYNESYDDLARARNTYDEVVDFIANEMVIAAKDLPLSRAALETQRPTRGAALATRAKALIYAASPWNNSVHTESYFTSELANFDGTLLMGQERNEEKWAKAADACKDVIDLGVYQIHVVSTRAVAADGYPATVEPYDDGDFVNKNWPEGYADIDPYESYRSLFNGSYTYDGQSEIIFGRGPAANQGENIKNQMVQHQMPQSIGGWNVHGMTLKQMDAYYMLDGTDVPGKDTYDAQAAQERVKGYTTAAGEYPHLDAADISLQFANREPRFYASVAFSGTKWPALSYSGNHAHLHNQIVHYYRGGYDGYLNGKLWLRTGIGSIKFYHPEDANNGDNAVIRDKVEPAIRYADILLLYAEALNEISNGGTFYVTSWDESTEYEITRDIAEIKTGIRPVRCRAGLPDYDDATYASQDKLREKIKRERQIEFFAESQRWFDLRRWKDAPVELNKPVYGFSVMMTKEQKDKFYTPTEVPQYAQVFTDKMYFWPISKTELKRNPLLTQNPGWQTFD